MTEKKEFSNLEKIFSPLFPLTRSKLQDNPSDGLEALSYNIELIASVGLDCIRLGAYGAIVYGLSQLLK